MAVSLHLIFCVDTGTGPVYRLNNLQSALRSTLCFTASSVCVLTKGVGINKLVK